MKTFLITALITNQLFHRNPEALSHSIQSSPINTQELGGFLPIPTREIKHMNQVSAFHLIHGWYAGVTITATCRTGDAFSGAVSKPGHRQILQADSFVT